MKQTVYVDVLVAINLLVDYFLLYAAAVIANRRRDRVRMCLGALAGAAGSMVILLPRMPAAVSLAVTALISAAMTVIAFGWGSGRIFLRSLTVMYALSAGYSGVMLLLWKITGGSGITVNNGAVYINVDPGMIVLVTVILYAAISFFSGKLRTQGLSRRRCSVTIVEKGVKLTLDGLIDTGNMLTEPFSGMPVLVASRSAVAAVVPNGIDSAAEAGAGTASAVKSRIRMVPYHTASGSGLMTAYRPGRIDIEVDGRLTENVSAYLALSDNNRGMTEAVIVNPDALGK